MSWINHLVASSVGKKLIMSLTGLFLCLFLVAHLAGNLLLLKNDGGGAFNQYAEVMSTNPLIRVAEVVLLFGFLFHLIDGIVLTLKNRRVRSVKYAVNRPSANSPWSSRNMGVTGSIVFVFLVVHLRTFVVEQRVLGLHESMYHSVKQAFENGAYSLFYVIAVVLLALHLNHGFQSAFQTLGINDRRYTPVLKRLGLAFSVLVPAGFILLPVYFYFKQFVR
jgi:succinate dehydrogenase / fumarate reductase cytochrome b subunit